MLKLATLNKKFFEVLDIEAKRKGISYTYHTLKELLNKGHNLNLLIGEDQAKDFTEWYKWESILEIVDVFVFKRSEKKSSYPEGLKMLNSRIIEISSTEIRKRIQEGKAVDFLLPEEVLNYIKTHDLYKS